ncbi:MAG: ribonuclease P protein component [Bacillota bacterium]
MTQVPTIKKNAEFNALFSSGRKYAYKGLVMIILPGQEGKTRFGWCISKRQGNAVERNRMRRRLKEAVRLILPDIKEGIDIVILGNRTIKKLKFEELLLRVRCLFKNAGIYKEGRCRA